MMRTILFGITLWGLSGAAFAQNFDQTSPVTQAEAAKIFGQMELALLRVVGVTPQPRKFVLNGDAPITRAMVAQEFHRYFLAAKPKFKITPRPVHFDPNHLRTRNKEGAVEVETLVKWGFIGPVTPVAIGPEDTVDLRIFGDAVGFFLSRLAELTHMPSTKFSPYMMRGD
ncbi:MAG: hypothetical protein ACK4XJ_10645 [Fimbriimonadaceae bacterium]